MPPGGGGGGREEAVLPYMGYIGMSRCESFQPVCSGIGYINQRVWVWSGYIFQETGQLVEDFSPD